MKKAPTLALLALSGISTASFAEVQNIDIQPGWNLKGSILDNVDVTEDLNNPQVKSVWAWVDGKWAVWSPDPQLQAVIEKYVKEGAIKNLQQLNAGEGFWVNSIAALKVSLKGIAPTDTKLVLNPGWNLVALKGTSSKTVEELFSNTEGIISVWKWVDGKWAVWSPLPDLQSLIQQYVAQGKILALKQINPGEGFWVNAGNPATIDTGTLEAPPQVGVAYVLQDELNAIPLKDADVYVNGKYLGKTDENGEFPVQDLKEGDIVTVKKSGYFVATGVVKNGSVVIVTQKDNSPKVPLKVSEVEGTQKPINKIISSADGSVALIVSSYSIPTDVTVSVTPIMATSAVGPINSIEGTDDPTITPDNIAVIGGALINIEDSNGKPLSPEEIQNLKVNFTLKISKFVGDLEDLLNGNLKQPSQNYQKFTEQVYQKLTDLIKEGQIDLIVLQKIKGKWVYKGKAKLMPFTVTNKNGDSTVTYTKYLLTTEETLNTLAPTVIALKLNYLVGKTQVCVEEGGYKMFDGSIVTAADSNSSQFDWVGKPIAGVTVLGDSAVQNAPTITGENGCAEIDYKVPFLKPTFVLSFKKKGYYDAQITCKVTSEGAECSEAKLYRIPDTASIEGYVRNKVTQEGIANALVTLVNPEVLSSDKVKYGSDVNGDAYVQVGYMPNVKYTWTAVKYDEQGNKVAEILLKEGQGSPEYAKLTESEIMKKLVAPFDNASIQKPVDAEYLLGNWELHVKAEHSFTNTSQKLVEEAIGSFDIDILMPKLAEIMGGQISEKIEKVTIGDNGTLQAIPAALQNIAIYGGPSVGFLYEVGPQLDSFEWRTKILGGGDPETTGCINDVLANQYGECYIDVAKDTLIYKKALYPIALNVQFLAKHFVDLLKPDPSCVNDPECEGHPFIQTGFTIRNLFYGKLEIPTTDGQPSVLEKYAASYVDVPYDLNRKVEDLVDIPSIQLTAPSVTAYMRQVVTKDNGYYRINMIPPELSGSLEIFAKAEGYKFDQNADIKLVNDLEAGKVSHYDLYLEPLTNPSKNQTVDSWDGWNFSVCPGSPQIVTWQVITNPETVKVSNTAWASQVWGTDTVTLLPDAYSETQGYLWFGDKETGMFSDTGENTSSAPVCGEAISPVIDLTNTSFPVLKFLTWFEVESVDVAKGMFDQLEIGFIIPKDENGGKDTVKIYASNGQLLELKTDTYYPISLLNPDAEPNIQEADVPYSDQGVNAIPVWMEYSLPVDYLAGLKVKFVFKFDSKDALYNGFRGWGIDKIQIIDSLNETLSTGEIALPVVPLPPSIPNVVNYKISR